jgi:hypothetical protein
MENIDRNIVSYEQGYIITFSLKKIIENQSLFRCDLVIGLSRSLSNDDTITLEFCDIKDLQIGQSINSTYCSSFVIREIKNWQWEGCNYQVIEEEENTLKFYCAKISGISTE